MADVLTHIDTLDAELDPPQQQNIEVGATAEQLLPLIDVNQNLAAANRQLVEQVLPTLRGGLQTKEVSPADIEQVITPDDGYLGLQRVKVAPYEREVQVVNRRANESEFLYYMEDIATQYQRSDYAVCMAGEFYKNADTTILAGADAYLTSDGDFYTAQTTHTWHDDDDIHANRWVVYYFKQGENKSNFMIADATACPYILAVRGHLGAIIANIATPISNIIVPDGSSVLDLQFSRETSFPSSVRIKNILKHTSGAIVYNYVKNLHIDLEEATTTIVPVYFQQLNNLYFPKLRNAALALYSAVGTGDISSVRNIYIPNLETCSCITGGYSRNKWQDNKITKIDAPKLKRTTYAFECYFICGTHIKEINLPLYEGVVNSTITGESFRVFSHIDSMEEINLPLYNGVKNIYDYHGWVVNEAASLKRLILPKFNLNPNASIFANCPALEYVYVPSCTLIQNEGYNGNVTCNMPNLKTYIIGKLNYAQYGAARYNAFLDCPRLIHLEAVMTQDINVQLPKWEPTEALNDNTDLIEDTNRCTTNREQFFVNFVEYILHKLQDRTGTSKLTLTLSATVYDAIFNDESGFVYNGQPIGGYVTSYIAGINWSVAKAS